MRKHLPTALLLLVVLGLLVGLNAIFLAQPGADEDERTGNRSAYSSGRYGTLAFYTLLKETGRQVEHFEVPWTSLDASGIRTLFIVWPKAEHQPSGEELAALDRWVLGGGYAVIADREIKLEFDGGEPSQHFAVETGTPVGDRVAPVLPSAYTRGVRTLRATSFANALAVSSGAAVTHVAGPQGAVVVDVPHGLGRMTFVSDTHFIENGGIADVDNAALALGLAKGIGTQGRIGFDEYHHGYGKPGGQGGIRGYVAGTPVPWIVAQLGLIGLLVAYGAGRRLTRAVPLARERRTTNLEFVTSMANIQRLASAEDLAIENIYTPFRARLCRYAGLSTTAPTDAVASDAARRARVNRDPLLDVMRKCEAVLAGDRPGPEEITRLVREIRKLEAKITPRR